MAFLKVFLILVEVLSCFLLIGLILIQRSKNEGMGGLAAGAGMGEALFGSRAGNVLTRATVFLACVFMVCTTSLAFVYSQAARQRSVIEDQLGKLPQAPAPQQGMPAPVPAPVPAPAPTAPAPQAAPVEVSPASPVNFTIPAPAVAPAPAAPAAETK